MTAFSAILTGFSIVSCIILCLVYLFSLPGMQKTLTGKLTCTSLMASLSLIQVAHFLHFSGGVALLENRAYVVLLWVIPVSFYFFSRELLFHGEKPQKKDLVHALILVPMLVLPHNWAALLAFVVGCGYTFSIYRKILNLRSHIPRFQFEKFFFALFFAMTLVAIALGLLLPVLNPVIFYHLYAGSISVAMVLIVAALLVFPDLLSDVLLATETVYASSKLGNVDTSAKQARLEQLMREDRCYENENLTLSSVAEQLEMSGQQLSELVNSSFGMSFPRYVRQHRVEAAKQMLTAEPDASVLSISMATGFKSQSSFYTAFKDQTGVTPAAFRKTPHQT